MHHPTTIIVFRKVRPGIDDELAVPCGSGSPLYLFKGRGCRVLGTYEFERQTVCEGNILQVGEQASIVLSRDGAFEAKKVPDLTDGRACRGNKLITGRGQWTIETVGSVDNGWGNQKIAWGVNVDGHGRKFLHWIYE